jgi:methyl-accepting chemotaxis protein
MMTRVSKFWSGIRLSRKLPLMIALPTIFLTVASGVFYALQAGSALKENRETAYITLLEERGEALDNWLKDLESQAYTMSVSQVVISAIRDFGNSWYSLGDNPGEVLRQAWVTGNPHPPEKRAELLDAGDKTAYSIRHKKYQAGFHTFQREQGFEDLYLMDPQGSLFYSVQKGDDFASNVITGPLRDTGLGRAFKAAAELKPGELHITPLESYAPAGGKPAMFIAAPVFKGDALMGVLALRVDISRMTSILSQSRLLGASGLVYAVRDGGIALNASPHEGGHAALDTLPPSPQIEAALAGEAAPMSGVTGLSGNPVESVTSQLTHADKTWGLVLEIDSSEAKAAEAALMQSAGIQAAVVSLMVAFLAWIAATSVARRVSTLADSVERISNQDFETHVPGREAGDELGRIAQKLEGFKDDLQAGRAAEELRAEQQQEQEQVVASLSVGLQQMAGGDFSQPISAPFPEGHEQLRADFNRTLETLNATVQQVVGSADSIRNGATEISQASDDLSRRTESQAATLEETAAALDEITASVKNAAEGARGVERIMQEAKGEAEESEEVVQNAVSAMSEIEQSSTQISQIIGVIDDIAFQTNLLALNAGVEAARAGDAGRGFAVVASEVRALAQRSADAAKEIKALISDSSQQVGRGVDLVGKAGNALNGIVERIGHISGLVSEIAEGASEQSTGIGEINLGVTQLDQVTQQNAAMVEEATAASHLLDSDAAKLAELVSRFTISGQSSPALQPAAAASLEPASFPEAESIPDFEAAPAAAIVETAFADAPSAHGDDWDLGAELEPQPIAVNDAPVSRRSGGADQDVWRDF